MGDISDGGHTWSVLPVYCVHVRHAVYGALCGTIGSRLLRHCQGKGTQRLMWQPPRGKHNYVMKPWHLPNNPASPSYYRLQQATSQLFGNQSPQHLHHHAVPGDPHAHTTTASWTSLFPALGPLACV